MKADKAQPVKPGSAIEGVFKATTPLWFVFEAKKGQGISAAFDGHRFDTRTELLATVLDDRGRELARTRRGEAIDLTLADDGVHRVVVQDRKSVV